MGKYLIKRIIHAIFSIIIVVAIVMLLIYGLLSMDLVFASDTTYSHL